MCLDNLWGTHMGDLNTHHPLWGSATYNINGRLLNNLLQNSDLFVLNDKTSTLVHSPLESLSPLDLTIANLEDCGDSHHFHTLAKINQK